MDLFLFLLIVGLGILFHFVRSSSHQTSIEEKVKELGGTIKNVEKCSFFNNIGPFCIVGKGKVVYKIEYKVNDAVKEGWVRFGGLLGPDWRW